MPSSRATDAVALAVLITCAAIAIALINRH